MNEGKNNCALQKAGTPRGRFLDFRCYFEANGQNHIHFRLIQVLKNSMASQFLTFRSLSTKLEFVYPPWSCGRVEQQMLIFSSSLTISKLTIVLIWKTPPCLTEICKTSNLGVENLPQRKLWVWAANDARSRRIFWYHRTSASACFFESDRSSHSRVRTRLIPSTTSKRVTHLHIPVPVVTRGTLARPHELDCLKASTYIIRVYVYLLLQR